MITVYGPRTTIEELRGIEPARPKGAGRRWRPVQHGDLVDTIRDEATLRGWQVEEELYTTAREGADMAGAMLLSGVPGAVAPTGMRLALGFLNSNARRKALQITVGAQVACCTNGMCTGNILMNQTHDHSFDLADAVEVALDSYVEEVAGVGAEVNRLRDIEISPAEASEILMRAGREQLVGWAAVGRVDREYRNPTFAEHGRDNAWALLNAFTYAARQNINPTRQMETYNAFRGMLPEPCLN